MSGAAASQAAVTAIRVLAMDAVERARSGHPGLPLAMAPAAYVLYAQVMRHDPADPGWPDRDRFVLSAGHGSMLLYATLHLAGYELPLSELERFRQWGSATPGHPEHGATPGVETTTGPLGQGFANGVGMAMAERFLRERFGPEVCDHRVFALCSDGDLMEGVSAEAASLAGHLGLGRLVYLYDDNRITIDGSTDLAFSGEDVGARLAACGWHVELVEDAMLLLASGSEVEVALAARTLLRERGIAARVVSFPSWERFEMQDAAYRDAVLLPAVSARVAVEAAVTQGWQRWTGGRGRSVGLDRFGASAPGPLVLERLGIAAARVADVAAEALEDELVGA